MACAGGAETLALIGHHAHGIYHAVLHSPSPPVLTQRPCLNKNSAHPHEGVPTVRLQWFLLWLAQPRYSGLAILAQVKCLRHAGYRSSPASP
jgi:hypothetical protein